MSDILTDMTEEQQSRQALDWLIVLHDRPQDGEIRERFDVWRSSSEINAKAWDEAQRLWNLIGDTPPAHAGAWTLHTAPSPSTELPSVVPGPSIRRSRRHARYWPSAVLVAGLAACLVLALPSAIIYWQAQHHTGIGETALVTLRDGSTVHLGANSAIRESDDPASRHVDLLKGQAFFEIVPDPSRPFQVSAAEWRTTVLGTAFDINLTPHAASVAVEHGSVLVDRSDDEPSIKQKLETGDWIRVEHDRGITAQGHGQPSQVAAWRQSRLVVKSRPIDEVIGELERYHRGLIVVTDAALKTRLVSGVYDLHHPIEALRAVVQPHQAVVRELTPYLVVVSSS